MIWKADDLRRFFGGEAFTSTGEQIGRIHIFRYVGSRLQYDVWIQEDIDWVAVSGDPDTPFGAHSFYEISLPCDLIATLADGYIPGQVALAFYHGGSREPENLRMTIMKRPDGDLKVWPAFPIPEGHPARVRPRS
jgi:hypothetical protein